MAAVEGKERERACVFKLIPVINNVWRRQSLLMTRFVERQKPRLDHLETRDSLLATVRFAGPIRHLCMIVIRIVTALLGQFTMQAVDAFSIPGRS